MRKTYRCLRSLLILGLLVFLSIQIYGAEPDRDALYQVSTLYALMEGVYDGSATLAELGNHGDFGLGTYEGLDGEMIELDHHFYQVKADGVVYSPSDDTKSPFAAVTYFEPDHQFAVKQPLDMKGLQSAIESMLPTKNIIYAVRIDGEFSYIKTRSVPKQNKPYPRLSEVTKTQPTFEFKQVKGTIIGYWLPDYMKGVNMPGFHLHFISDDRKAGGHLLDCVIDSGKIQLDDTFRLNLVLPTDSDFYRKDLTADNSHELEKIEK